MNKLDELINQLCPDGVEYFKLGKITSSINIGINPRKFFMLNPENAEGFYVTVRELNGLQGVKEYDKTDKISLDAVRLINGRANIEVGDLLFSNTGTVGKMALVVDEPRNWSVNEGIYVIKPLKEIVDSRFLFYYLASGHAYRDYSGKFTGSTLKHVTQKALADISIPIPPLDVQSEIVRILDNFTELTAELTAELASRKKQYEYYSQQLLLSIDAESVPISDLGKWMGGKTPSMNNKQYWERGIIPWISSKDMKAAVLSDTQDHITEHAVNDASMTVFPAGTVAIVTRSGILKHTFPVVYVPFETTINQDIKALKVKEGVSARYVSLAMQAFSEDIRKKTKKQGGTVDSLEFSKVLSYEIPLPSYEKQLEVVGILERFDSLCNSLSNGLPAEIDARQKQYEFYRDKLLTFKEKAIS